MAKFTSNQFAPGAVITTILADKAVTSEKLEDNLVLRGNIVIDGNLSITGDLANEDTRVETLLIESNEIVINAGLTSANPPNADGGRIRVNRGNKDRDVYLRWREDREVWQFDQDLEMVGTELDTDGKYIRFNRYNAGETNYLNASSYGGLMFDESYADGKTTTFFKIYYDGDVNQLRFMGGDGTGAVLTDTLIIPRTGRITTNQGLNTITGIAFNSKHYISDTTIANVTYNASDTLKFYSKSDYDFYSASTTIPMKMVLWSENNSNNVKIYNEAGTTKIVNSNLNGGFTWYAGGTADANRLLQLASDKTLTVYSALNVASSSESKIDGGLLVGDNTGTIKAGYDLDVRGPAAIDGGLHLDQQAKLFGYNNTLWYHPSGTYTSSEFVTGTAYNWDTSLSFKYTPGTIGAASGLLTIGQIQKNNTNFTHGVTALYTNGLERMRIDSSGRVGIGMTPVTEKLEVNGNVKATTFISTIATGTAPITIASSTMVGNLNAQYLGGNLASAFSLATHDHNSTYLRLIGGSLSGNIVFTPDDAGIDFYQGAKIWKKVGGGLRIKPHNDAAGVTITNVADADLLVVKDTAFTYKGNAIYHAGQKPTLADVGALGAIENAVSASKWQTARTLTLSGDVSGNVSIDGTTDATLNVTVADDSHTHTNYRVKQSIYTTTTAVTEGYYRVATIPITAIHQTALFKIRAYTATGTSTESTVNVNLAYLATNYAAQSSSVTTNTSHSYNSSTSAENGYVLLYCRVSFDATNAYIDFYKYKATAVTIEVQPLVESDWVWATGALTVNPTVGAYRNVSVTMEAGFRGSSISAAYASYSSYSSYGVLGGNTLSNATDKTGQWYYFGNWYFAYNSGYLKGHSGNIRVRVQELSYDGTKDPATFDSFILNIKVNLGTHTDSATFNTLVPTYRVEIEGETSLTVNDIVGLVYSSSTTNKYIRFYIKSKEANTFYTVDPEQRYGRSFVNSTYTQTTSYCYFNIASDQAPIVTLPTPVQGTLVYAVKKIMNSDLLNGQNGSYYLNWTNATNKPSPTITLSGDVTGLATLTDLGSATIDVTISDDSHSHVIANIDGLQSELDGKAPTSHGNHVPVIQAANNAVFLRNDNTWQTITPANIGAATSGHDHSTSITGSSAKWTTARTITLGGDLTGNVSIDGSANVTLTATVTDDSHFHYSQKAIDDRDIKPNEMLKGYNQQYFTSKEGMNGVAGTDYQDLFILNTYVDASAGKLNALAFDKDSMLIAHYQAAQSDIVWGTPKTLAYTDSNITGSSAKWTTPRTITLAGDLTGNVSIDGSANVTLTATIVDDSHAHIIDNVDGLQTALDGKSPTSHDHNSTYLPLTGGTISGSLNLTDTNTALSKGTNNSLRVTTPSGYIDLGPQNTSYTHISTDRPTFYLNKPISVDGEIRVFNTQTYLSSTEGKIAGNTITTFNDIGSIATVGDRTTSKIANVLDIYNVSVTANGALQRSGGTIDGNLYVNSNSSGVENNGNKLYITRSLNSTSEFASHNVSDTVYTIHYKNDESTSSIKFLLENTDTESGGGASANTKTIEFIGSLTEAKILVNGSKVLTEAMEGHGNGIDVDTLDGQHGSYYAPISNPEFNGGRLAIRDNSIEEHLTNANASIVVNYLGYSAGITQFRDLNIYNGKNGLIAKFEGATSNVGIGNASPGKKLDVTGDIRASAQLISTVATGTAPIAVTSTTMVANLNADMLEGLHSASANTVSTIVARDASGNFSAGTITATLSGNASTATSAGKLTTARSITLTGDVTGTVNFDGSANVSITTTVVDDSHAHIIGDVDGLQGALDGKSPTTHDHEGTYLKLTGGTVSNSLVLDNAILLYGKSTIGTQISIAGVAVNDSLYLGDATVPLIIRTSQTPTITVGANNYTMWHSGNFTPGDKLDSTSYTAADVLAKLLTVDGAGSLVDADTIDGLQASAFALTGHNHSGVYSPVGHGHTIPDVTNLQSTLDAKLSNAYLSGRSISDPNSVDDVGVAVHYLASGATSKPTGTDHSMLTMSYSNVWSNQMAADWRTNEWYVRNQNNGIWGSWRNLWHSGNFNPADKLNATSYTAADILAKLLTVDGSGSLVDADTVDGLEASVFLRNDITNPEIRISATHGSGIKFWDSNAYKIYMSSATEGTWGGRTTGETTSDYNMYFKMSESGGTNRGFVFKSDTTPVAGIDSNGDLRVKGSVTAGDNKFTMEYNDTNETIEFIFN